MQNIDKINHSGKLQLDERIYSFREIRIYWICNQRSVARYIFIIISAKFSNNADTEGEREGERASLGARIGDPLGLEQAR